MIGLILQAGAKVDARVVIKEQFTKTAWDPSTLKGIILVVAAFLCVAVILHFLLYYQKRLESPRQYRNTHKLYRELLRELGLSISHRDLMKRLAFDLRLPVPARMLLSPRLFQQHGQQWLSKVAFGRSRQAKDLQTIARRIFPSDNLQFS